MIERLTAEMLTEEVIDEMTLLGSEFFNMTQSAPADQFNPKFFFDVWRQLLMNGTGTVFVSKIHEDRLTGGIGLILTPDMFTGKVIGVEAFWFVGRNYRGGSDGLRLLMTAIAWAKELNLSRLVMAHLHCAVSEKASSVYGRSGFKQLETHYELTWP